MKKKLTGGAKFRHQKQNELIKKLALFGLFFIGFLVFGAIFDDAITGVCYALAPLVIPAGTDAIEAKRLTDEWNTLKAAEDAAGGEAGLAIKKMVDEFNAKQVELKKLIADGKAEDTAKIKSLEDSLAEMKEKQIANLNDIVVKQGIAMTALKAEFAAKGKIEDMTLVKEVRENMVKLKSISRSMSNEELVLKTLVQRSAITSNTQAQDVPGIGQMAFRKMTIYDLFPKITVGENNNGTIRYWDWDTSNVTRGAAAYAEAGTVPESVAKWKQYTLTICKVGDSIPVTDEFFEDEAMFASELEFFLNTNVALEIDRQLVLATGTGSEMTGLVGSTPAYVPSSAGIQDCNVYDLIVKMKESITTTGGGKYDVNFALMNIADINRLKLKKDNNDNYIIYPNASRDGQQVDGIQIIECNILTANTLIIGDKRFAKIYEKKGIEITRGQINAQFTTDESTLKARARLAFLIRTVDQTGFSRCTDISAAIATLATAP